jgi:hypothetical protein
MPEKDVWSPTNSKSTPKTFGPGYRSPPVLSAILHVVTVAGETTPRRVMSVSVAMLRSRQS